jgi:hypothetical protein
MVPTNMPAVAPDTIMRLQSAIYAPMAMLAGMPNHCPSFHGDLLPWQFFMSSSILRQPSSAT